MRWRRKQQDLRTVDHVRIFVTTIVIILGSQIAARALTDGEDRWSTVLLALGLMAGLMVLAFVTRLIPFGWERVPDR